MNRKTRLLTVNSKIDVEQNNHDNWRQRATLTYLHQPKSKKDTLKYLQLMI